MARASRILLCSFCTIEYIFYIKGVHQWCFYLFGGNFLASWPPTAKYNDNFKLHGPWGTCHRLSGIGGPLGPRDLQKLERLLYKRKEKKANWSVYLVNLQLQPWEYRLELIQSKQKYGFVQVCPCQNQQLLIKCNTLHYGREYICIRCNFWYF